MARYKVTGGAAVVRALEANGVDVVFGIPGTHNLEVYRYLTGSSIRHVTPRHEQGAGYAADGYTRSTGRPGVAITTSGPGLTNICTAAATAYADSIPMLVISPGVPRGLERADVGWLHEVKDQQAHMDNLLERSVRVGSTDQAAAAINEAFARWRVERPRPVHIEIPLDVLEEEWAGADGFELPIPEVAAPQPSEQAVTEAVRLLGAAVTPVVVLGGGTRHIATKACRLVELLDAPVLTTVNGKGVVPESNPLSLGASIRLEPAQRLVAEADVALLVGTELGDSDLWGGSITPGGAVIRVDIDAGQLDKNLPATVRLHGDSATVLTLLAEALEGDRTASHADGASRAAAARAEIHRAALVDGEPWREVQEVLRSVLPADVIVAGDSSQVTYYGTVHFWPMEAPGQFLYPLGYATLGYGLPAGIGAKLGNPERAVVVLVGDGAFMFTASELVTAAEQRLPIPVVVMNNHGFGEIADQMDGRGIARLAVDLTTPDFAALGRACGAHGERLSGLDGLGQAVQRALRADGPTVIDVDVSTRGA